MNEWARDQIHSLEQVWNRYWPYIQELTEDQLNHRLREGRTVKEVLAHIAFWEEAAVGFVRMVIRGEPVQPEEWYGGTDLMWKDGDPWPPADVHNAREAAWARSQSRQAILERMQAARRHLIDFLGSVTQPEADGLVGEFLGDPGEDRVLHFEGHLAEIQAELAGEG